MPPVTPATRPVKLSWEDFLTLPPDDKRHELIDGDHYVTPSPSRRHQTAVGNLYRILATPVRERRLGRLYVAPFDVVLSRHDVVEPDLLFLSTERLGRLTEANVQGAPDLVIEVVSPRTAAVDRGAKRRAYEKFGVGEYWLVEPEDGTVLVVRFGETPGGAEWRLGAGQAITSPLLPGLSIPVGEIFTD